MEQQIFKKGDKVYDIHRGWGKVVRIIPGDYYPITVKFDKTRATYTLDGIYTTDALKCLSFTDYSGAEAFSQVRPLPKVKKGQLIYVWSLGIWDMRYFSHFENGKPYCFTNQNKSGGATSWAEYSIENPLDKS